MIVEDHSNSWALDWCMIEGGGHAYVEYGKSKAHAISRAVKLWIEKRGQRIPETITTHQDIVEG